MANTMTRNDLMEIHNDLQSAKVHAKGLAYIMRSRINDFYFGNGSGRGNGVTVDQTIKSQSKLQREYMVITEGDKPEIMMTDPVPAVPAKMEKNEAGEYVEVEAAIPAVPAKPVMKEGKTYEEFNEKWQALMAEMVNVY